MKRLTLFRHGKAAALSARGGDFDRPLAPRGEADARRVVAHVKARLPVPDCLLSSPAARAAATARIAAGILGLDVSAIGWEPELYLASPAMLLSVIRRAPAAATHVLLTGHNPGLADLAAALLSGALSHLPTAGAVSVDLDIDDWRALSAHTIAVADPLIVCPRDLRG